MARRPSVVSVSSAASTSTLPHHAKSPSISTSPLQTFKTPTSPWPHRTVSLSAISKSGPSGDSVDPDELFTKFTVAEVRTVHNRLIADADAKQEELRLMVGERYRDLLQASTSIISIAQSSQNVLDALEDMKTSIPSAEEAPQLIRRSQLSGKDDTHLQVLQSLAAHMKLLLDTPEHLWRLLEKKKYLHAGWLYLLARVIHRALLREDSEDDDNWKAHGIDVVEQFPLVQRQWDAVAQFRTQITYKATLSLREFNSTAPDICSVLLTLHLLESRPLSDTLSTFLAQRTRSLQSALSRSPKATQNGQSSQLLNGNAGTKTRKTVLRELRETFEGVLDVIALTVGAAREIFHDGSSARPSLMRHCLQHIQSDSDPEPSLPPELHMSTQHLLTSLPSASHFVLLPPTVRSYKPYIDLTSSTSSIPPDQLSHRLQDWFQKAVQDLQAAAEAWFSDLKALKDVWTIRGWVTEWVTEDGRFEENERAHLTSALDVLVHKQATQIWRSAFSDMETIFQSELGSAVSALREGANSSLSVSPAKHLFQAPPTPSAFDASQGSASMVSSFRKYKAALHRQVSGRTPLLEKVMKSVETRAAALHSDVQAVDHSEEDNTELTGHLKATYLPCAERSVTFLLNSISSSITSVTGESCMFSSRVADEMSSSQFLSDLQLGTDSGNHVHEKLHELYELGMERWRKLTIASIVDRYREIQIDITLGSGTHVDGPAPAHPSSSLMEALLAVSNSVQTVATSTRIRPWSLAELVLRDFISSLLDELDDTTVDSERQRASLLWDVKLLHELAGLWGPEWSKVSSRLKATAAQFGQETNGSANHSPNHSGVSAFLTRTQVLLAPILPPTPPTSLPEKKDARPEGLLHLGAPVVDSQVQPAMELVKPGPRFGLLLVGSTSIR
ncbi:hypothetical protein FA95DRAFT_1495802 [Auriscalpium vulgare]|uniref:Uncharacterized protein n=1 Tax=Auriscalpium vulgare TaxID=40419 RepID=A0ACB8RM58_9AGAM|nr:hypothetical protein FA95DRAFT_1495802 [Auriscalpium vulgare]